MKTVKGLYVAAKIFTDDVEDYALAQVKMICDNEIADGSTIRMMRTSIRFQYSERTPSHGGGIFL